MKGGRGRERASERVKKERERERERGPCTLIIQPLALISPSLFSASLDAYINSLRRDPAGNL